jgi:hypothetical protein
LRRLVRQPQVSQALLLAVGLAILANSRPFEGLIASLPMGGALLVYLLGKQGPTWRVGMGRIVLPILLVLGLAAGGMACYNERLTGDLRQFPYQQNGSIYGMVPVLVWQPLGPEPEYHHAVMKAYQVEWAKEQYLEKRTLDGYFRDVAKRLQAFLSFFLGIALLVPVLALPWAIRGPWLRWAAATCGLVFGALLVTTWCQPHYAAPVTSLVFLLLVQGLRHLRLWKWHGREVGRAVLRALPLVYVGSVLTAFVLAAQVDEDAWYRQRARLQEHLEQDPDRHLVIVRYGEDHSPLEEWVYNRADIDGTKVVWARDMGPARNTELREHFRDRRIWLLEADAPTRRLVPYPDPQG